MTDKEIKALYVAQHGVHGWLGIAGNYFASGVKAALRQPPAERAALSDEQCWALRDLGLFNAVEETKGEFIQRVRATLTTQGTKP